MSPELQAGLERWQAKQPRDPAPVPRPAATFEAARENLRRMFEQLPERPEVPREHTRKGERWHQFAKVCDPMFRQKIDRAQLTNAAAFDVVAGWDGAFPGVCAVGPTGTGKTRAAWVALCRLYVHERELTKAFAWFPVRRLVTELARYQEAGIADEFFRTYDLLQILFVDDADKINWNFDSEKAALFAFYDWVYRRQKPCITTTNKERSWWAERMGEAFARRMFEDAHRVVSF